MEKQTRFEYNLAIIDKLKELVIKYPDFRFGQLLVNCDILKISENFIGESNDGKRRNYIVDDPFNEESKVTWERMYNNKFAFHERFN